MLLNRVSFSVLITNVLIGSQSLIFISPAYSASPDEWRCKSYARDAIEQNAKNQSASCGFTGGRWNNDKAGQQQWCLTVSKDISYKEDYTRKQMLGNCYAKKSARNNPENQLNIPLACKDPSGAYLPIRSVYSRYRYEKNLHTPVGGNGLIQYDYNIDGQYDYVFVERNSKDKMQLTTCFSNGESHYQRQLTDVNFYANLNGLSSEQSFISIESNLLTIEINYFGHNEGTCSANGAYTYNKKKKHFEIVVSDASCYPVIDTEGQPYPMSSPLLPKMYRDR